MKHTHIVSLAFENGNRATITVQDRPDGATLHIEGLNHIVSQKLESFTIHPIRLDKRLR